MDNKYHRLSSNERYYLYKQKAIMSVAEIAKILDRHRSSPVRHDFFVKRI